MEILDDYPEYEDPLHNALCAARETMHVPDLADAWLGILSDEGSLPDASATVITHKGKPLRRPITEDPVNTPSDPSVYPARLDNGQVIWIKLHNRGLSGTLFSASVADKPDSLGAVLAALTMMEGDEVDIGQLQRSLPLVDLSYPAGISERVYEIERALMFSREKSETLELIRAFPVGPVRLALALLRYYRPGFDDLPEVEKRDLLIGCCERMNRTIAAIRQLTGFLEYGAPGQDQRSARVDPHRDVRAAVMRDVEKETYPKIAARLRIKVSEKAEYVGDYSTASKAVGRGRDILVRALGKDGWEKAAAEMRREHVRREALSEPEKFVEDLAQRWRVSGRFAQSLLEGEDPTPEIRSRVDRSEFRLAKARNYYEALVYDHERH
jgi:hypothetical protein